MSMDKPFPYQEEGVRRMADFFCQGNHGVILGDDMGLGKTVQALLLINALRPLHVLVVCPASVKINWEREARKWVHEDYVIGVMDGRGAVPVTPGFPLIEIVNYDFLQHLDFSKCEYDLVVYDEAHYLKSPDAQRTVAASRICTSKRLLMTGTPIINRPKEIWQLMLLCGMCSPEEFHKFGLKYCGARKRTDVRMVGPKGGKFPKRVVVWDYDGASNLDELNHWLRKKCLIRRLKKDVLTDLPDKTRQIIELPRDGSYEKDVQFFEKAELLVLTRGMLCLKGHDRDSLKYMQSVNNLNDEIRLAFEEISLIRHETALEKMEQVLAFICHALESSDKIVVFAHHRDVVEEIATELWHAGMKPVQHHGGMTGSQKQSSVDAFQNDPSCRVFVGNIASAGVGITLTAASHVIFAELDWAPAMMTQCEDRCHRYGQKDNVLVQHLVYENSIDARIAKTLVKKQKIIDSAIDGTTSGAVDWLSELTNSH